MARRKRSSSKNPLSQTLKAIKKIGLEEDIVELDPDSFKESRPHITTGSIMLDRTIGGPRNKFGVIPCPGWPLGGVINIYGHESSGKTTLALATAAEVTKAGGTVMYVDWENEISPAYAAELGVDTEGDLFSLLQPTTLEGGMKQIWAAAHYGVDLIVIDSVGAGIPEEWVEDQALKEKGKMGRVGLVAAKWSKFLPQVKSKLVKSDGVMLAISQLRANIQGFGSYGPKHTVQGGNTWKYHSAIRMMLRKVKTHTEKRPDPFTGKDQDVPCAITVRAKLDKCKVAATQQNECEFYIRFGEGIDNISSYIDIASDHGIITKSGSWYKMPSASGDEISVQGAANLREHLVNDEKTLEVVRNEAYRILYESDKVELETSSKSSKKENESDEDKELQEELSNLDK